MKGVEAGKTTGEDSGTTSSNEIMTSSNWV